MTSAEARVDHIVDGIRSRGGRMNEARLALITTLVETGGHVTAEELAHAVRRTHPHVHDATVYRNLEALERLGVLTHLHLSCTGCGTVVELPQTLVRPLARTVQARWGFELDLGHFALLGRCGGCRPEAGATTEG
jgi:Fur family ferric uptake transcriptional regulator